VKYFLQRIAFYVFTAWAAITLNFFIPRMIPGDPVTALLSRFQGQLSSDAIQSLYVLFGIDRDAGLWSQYLDYWQQIFRVLKEGDYRGAISVELEDEQYNGSEAGEKSGFTSSLAFLRSV